METFNKRCVALYSGGLDSLLAVLIMKNLGFEVFPVFVKTPFYKKYISKLQAQLKKYDLNLIVVDDFDGYISMLLNPKYGYGKHFNPCIDCKIFFLKKAKAVAKNIDASFFVTGDVVGQRPMSQRSYSILRSIEKNAGVEDTVLRPLSAACLPETKMEKAGLIKREQLYCIKGRLRKPQFELAKQFSLEDFETPAGGCLLTDLHYSKKLKDLKESGEIDKLNIQLLEYGRHFRINGSKFVISRNENETKTMKELFGDLPHITSSKGPAGIGIFTKEMDLETIKTAASIFKRYAPKAEKLKYSGSATLELEIDAMDDKLIEHYRIGG